MSAYGAPVFSPTPPHPLPFLEASYRSPVFKSSPHVSPSGSEAGAETIVKAEGRRRPPGFLNRARDQRAAEATPVGAGCNQPAAECLVRAGKKTGGRRQPANVWRTI